MTTILVVDDSQQNIYQLQVLLRSDGYQVVTAGDGAEALSTARQDPPDLIVTDGLMPVMDGFTLCRECQQDERLKAIPLIFYTATFTDDRDRQLALRLGARRYLVKPEALQDLLPTIREELQRARRPPLAAGELAAGELAAGELAAGEGTRQQTLSPADDETVNLKLYNEALVRKLEKKMLQLEQTNRELTQELANRQRAEAKIREQLQELQRWHDITLDREGRVMDLKREVNELLVRQGLPPRYSSVLEDA
jgi:CheY-like chemotaxis protein